MTVRLKSLRVVSDFDSKGYSTGAAEKVAADLRMIRSGDQLGVSLARADQQLINAVPGMARLSRSLLDGYASGEKFEKALRQIGNAMDHGMSADRAVAMVLSLEKAYQRVASASDLAREGLHGVASAIRTAQVDQSKINQAYGVNFGTTKSARESAEVFQEQAREYERLGRAANALREIVNPLAAAQDRLNAELAEYRAMADAGVITTWELAAAQDMANVKFLQVSENIRRTGNNVRLGRHEVANLSYQLNDIAVMVASGQSPFMLLMQQGMQIGQILGPHGLRGGIQALGQGIIQFLFNPVNLAVVGFAALTAGAVYAFAKIRQEGRTLKDVLDDHREALDNLAKSYGEFGADMARTAPQNARVAFEALLAVTEEANTRLIAEQSKLLASIRPQAPVEQPLFGEIVADAGWNSQYSEFAGIIDKISAAANGGKAKVSDLQIEIVNLMRASRDNDEIQKVGAELLKLAQSAEQAQRQIEAAKRAIEFEPYVGTMRAGGNVQDMVDRIQGMRNDPRSKLEILDQETQAALGSAQTFGMVNEVLRQAALTRQFLNAEIQKSVALGDLEVRSIYARSPAQKAAIAAERERINAINQSMGAEEIAAQVAAASRAAYAQATFAITEQNRVRLAAANDNIRTAELETRLIGSSNAERALATSNLQTYLDLQRQAAENGLAFDQAQYDLLVKKNAEAARYNEQLAVQQAFYDLGKERGYSEMNPRDAEVERKLVSAGVTEGTSAYEQLRQAYIALSESQRTFTYGARQAFYEIYNEVTDYGATMKNFYQGLYQEGENVWTSFARTGKLSLDTLQDYLAQALAKMSYQFAVSGIMQMFQPSHPLYGGGGGLGGILSSLFNANGNAFAYGSVARFANGGAFTNSVVNRPTAFAYGGKFGVMGEAGPEAVMPLSRGRDGKLGVASNGGGVVVVKPDVNVTYIGQNNPEISAQPNDNGGLELVIREVARSEAIGVVNSMMPNTYGITKTRTRR